MDVDEESAPSCLERVSLSTIERAHKPPHLHLSSSNSGSIDKAQLLRMVGSDMAQSNRNNQTLSRFGLLQSQLAHKGKLTLGPRKEGSDTREEHPLNKAYVLDSGSNRGSSLPPPNVPRTLPAMNTQPDSSQSSGSNGLASDRSLSRQTSNASLASIDTDPGHHKRPRSRTVNLPSISQLFPDDGRATKIPRVNQLHDQSQAQAGRTANRPRSLSDVVMAQGRSGPPPMPGFQQQIRPAQQTPSNRAPAGYVAANSMQNSHPLHDAHRANSLDSKPRPPPINAPKLPISHAHNSSTRRFRCPLYSCSGKLTTYKSKVKAALLKCDDCERIYWQCEESSKTDESLCPC